jgi:hypothetical protein
MAEPVPLRAVPAFRGEVIGEIALPAELIEGRCDITLAEVAAMVRRLRRENGRLRQRLSAIERLLSEGESGGARRRELRERANGRCSDPST